MILSTLSPSPLGTPTRVRAVIIHPKVKIELQQLGLPGHPTFPPFARTRERVYLHAFLRSLPLHWTLLHLLLPSFRIQHAKPSSSSSVCAEVHHHLSSSRTRGHVYLLALLHCLPLHWTLLHPLLPSFRIQHAKLSPSGSVCAEVHHLLSSPRMHERVHLPAFSTSS